MTWSWQAPPKNSPLGFILGKQHKVKDFEVDTVKELDDRASRIVEGYVTGLSDAKSIFDELNFTLQYLKRHIAELAGVERRAVFTLYAEEALPFEFGGLLSEDLELLDPKVDEEFRLGRLPEILYLRIWMDYVTGDLELNQQFEIKEENTMSERSKIILDLSEVLKPLYKMSIDNFSLSHMETGDDVQVKRNYTELAHKFFSDGQYHLAAVAAVTDYENIISRFFSAWEDSFASAELKGIGKNMKLRRKAYLIRDYLLPPISSRANFSDIDFSKIDEICQKRNNVIPNNMGKFNAIELKKEIDNLTRFIEQLRDIEKDVF